MPEIVNALKEAPMDDIQEIMFNTSDMPEFKLVTDKAGTRAFEVLAVMKLREERGPDIAAKMVADMVESVKSLQANGMEWQVPFVTMLARKPQ